MKNSIGLDPKTKIKFDMVNAILEHHADRTITQPETLRFLIKVFTELEEAPKLKLLEEI